jgi:hypothetical protein
LDLKLEIKLAEKIISSHNEVKSLLEKEREAFLREKLQSTKIQIKSVDLLNAKKEEKNLQNTEREKFKKMVSTFIRKMEERTQKKEMKKAKSTSTDNIRSDLKTKRAPAKGSQLNISQNSKSFVFEESKRRLHPSSKLIKDVRITSFDSAKSDYFKKGSKLLVN